jgi:exoribonuclease-2
MLHVLDAPTVTSGTEAEEADEGEEELLDAANDSAESEAEAQAEAGTEANAGESGNGGQRNGGQAEDAPAGQHVAEPGP